MIEVVSPGARTSVEDLGLLRQAHRGVSAGGAADPIAAIVANRLVGNPDDARVLEMTLAGAALRFHAPAVIALAGAPFAALLDAAAVPWGAPVTVSAGQTLRVKTCSRGLRCALAVAGGIVDPPRATVVVRGARLQLGAPSLRAPATTELGERSLPGGEAVVRATVGPQADRFTPAAVDAFFAERWTVSADSDRRGVRLAGAPLVGPIPELLTEGVSLGAVQVPSSGLPIIMFVDQQTTGGYCKIANVISADLAHLGQLRPGTGLRFARVTVDEAHAIYRAWRAALFPREGEAR